VHVGSFAENTLNKMRGPDSPSKMKRETPSETQREAPEDGEHES